MYYRISLEGYQIICVRSFSFAVNIRSRSPKKHLLIWNSETTQNLNIYLYNYQTETAIFLATKHEKIIVACSYLNFYKYFLHFELLASSTTKNEVIHVREYINTENISKQQKTVADVRNCLVKMTLRLF